MHTHPIWMSMLIGISEKVGKSHTIQSLLLSDGAILMGKEESLEIHDFFSEGAQLTVESFIFSGVVFDLGLKTGEPLLLALTTFESGNPVSLEEVLPLFLVGHLSTTTTTLGLEHRVFVFVHHHVFVGIFLGGEA